MAAPSAQTLQRLADETGHQLGTLEKVRLMDLRSLATRSCRIGARCYGVEMELASRDVGLGISPPPRTHTPPDKALSHRSAAPPASFPRAGRRRWRRTAG